MTFEKVLKEVGDFGRFQKVFVCGFIVLSMTLMSTTFWTQVFILLVPPHRCKISPEDIVWSALPDFNISKFESTECHLNIVDNETEDNFTGASSCPHGWLYDYSNMYQSFSSQYDWVCGDSWKIYTTHTCYWIGSVVGFLIFGNIIDKFGRKRAFMGCVCLMIVGDVITFFANSFPTFVVARFVCAIGDCNLGTCSFIWAIEFIGPKYRVLALAVWAVSFTLFSTALPFIVYAINDWHYLLVMLWCFGVIVLVVSSFVPESGSWLITKDRIDDAAECMQRVAKINNKSLSLQYIKNILQKNSLSNSESKSQANGKSKSDTQTQNLSYLEAMMGLVRTPNMRKNTILLFILWMLATMCYIGSTLETSNLPLNFRLSYAVGAISELPANILCLLILDKIGRRWANVTFFVVAGFCGITAGGFIKNPTAVVVLVTIMRLCNTANFDTSFTFTSELFPTVVRGRAVSMARICGGLANAISPFIFSLSEIDKLLPVLVFGVLCIMGGILTLFLPEPAGQPLPHTLEDGEIFGKTQSFFYCPLFHRDRSSSQAPNNSELSAVENKAFEHSSEDGATAR